MKKNQYPRERHILLNKLNKDLIISTNRIFTIQTQHI